jgi:methylated-DNA-protein-cysteine methyltransferase related protein
MNESANYALYERIYQAVEQVPHGMVATYGDIATIVGGGCDARTVGYALNEVPPERAATVPWQRIINKAGGISTRGLLQRQILEGEGIEFDARGNVIMARYHWAGPDAEWAAAHGFHTLPPPDEGAQAEQLSLF